MICALGHFAPCVTVMFATKSGASKNGAFSDLSSSYPLLPPSSPTPSPVSGLPPETVTVEPWTARSLASPSLTTAPHPAPPIPRPKRP